MIEYCVFYGENGERHIVYATDPGKFDRSLPPGRKWDFPDELKLVSRPLIKREKTIDEIRAAGLMKKYGHSFRFYAKDIPLSRAIPKEFK